MHRWPSSDIIFSAFIFSAVSIVFDSVSHKLPAFLNPWLPAHHSQMLSLSSVSAQLAAFIYEGLWLLSG